MDAISAPVDLNVVRWYVMIAFKKERVAKEELEAANRERERKGMKRLDFFLPMYFTLKGPEKRKKRQKCPLIPNYLFIHASLNDIYAYKQTADYLKFHRPLVTDGVRRYTTVPEAQMRDFIRVAGHYEKDICYYAPGELDLVKGDKVRIIGGEFDGVEGVLLSTQGKRGDRVVIEIPGVMSVATCSISPDLIEILSYSADARHLYNDLKAFFIVARRVLLSQLRKETVAERDIIRLRGFVRRMENTKTDTLHAEGSLHLLLSMAHRALSDDELSASHLYRCRSYLPHLTSDAKRVHYLTYLFACTGDAELAVQARSLISSWPVDRLSAKQQELISDLKELILLFGI